MKISVVVPCYNCENTIQTCLNSIFIQIYKVYEIICIDDGSKDSTLQQLYRLKLECPSDINFIIITQKNSGPSVARNQGISIASGEWVAFLDSDDYWLNSKLYEDTEFIKKTKNAKLVATGNLSTASKKIEFNELLYKNYFMTSSILVEKSCILSFGFDPSQKYSEDYKTWLQIVFKYDAYIHSPQSSFPIDNIKHVNDFYLGHGLSSKLWMMEKGELSNYWFVYKENKISLMKLVKVSTYSLLKFLRRLYLVKKSIFHKNFR